MHEIIHNPNKKSKFLLPTTSHKLIHTHNPELPLLSKPNENNNTHKPKTQKPHKSSIFEATKRITKKENSP